MDNYPKAPMWTSRDNREPHASDMPTAYVDPGPTITTNGTPDIPEISIEFHPKDNRERPISIEFSSTPTGPTPPMVGAEIDVISTEGWSGRYRFNGHDWDLIEEEQT